MTKKFYINKNLINHCFVFISILLQTIHYKMLTPTGIFFNINFQHYKTKYFTLKKYVFNVYMYIIKFISLFATNLKAVESVVQQTV